MSGQEPLDLSRGGKMLLGLGEEAGLSPFPGLLRALPDGTEGYDFLTGVIVNGTFICAALSS
jgi:hypothetical protein